MQSWGEAREKDDVEEATVYPLIALCHLMYSDLGLPS